MFLSNLLRAINTLAVNGNKPICTTIHGEKFRITGAVPTNQGVEITYSKSTNSKILKFSELPSDPMKVYIKIDDNYGDITRVAYNDEGEIEIFYDDQKLELPKGEIIE